MKFEICRTCTPFDVREIPCEGAVSDLVDKEWTIEIHDLKELMELIEKEGKIVVLPGYPKHNQPPKIEIYDNWRE